VRRMKKMSVIFPWQIPGCSEEVGKGDPFTMQPTFKFTNCNHFRYNIYGPPPVIKIILVHFCKLISTALGQIAKKKY
jgi:hypothetical protein